jgi:hypothetical protein
MLTNLEVKNKPRNSSLANQLMCVRRAAVLFAFVGFCFPTGCDRMSDEERRLNETVQQARNDLLQSLLKFGDSDRRAELLALKHDVPFTNIVEILDQFGERGSLQTIMQVWELKTLTEIEDYKSQNSSPNTTRRVLQYSVQSGIPVGKVAAIIIDNEVWSLAANQTQ